MKYQYLKIKETFAANPSNRLTILLNYRWVKFRQNDEVILVAKKRKMGQFDNFRSIAMLFTGAFLVSFGVIAFLNIEIQSRSHHGVKIKNENLFEVLGKKINKMISTLRERNSYRRSLLYHIFVPENTTRTPLRKLQYFTEETVGVDTTTEYNYKRTRRLRHGKKMKRLTEILLKEKNNSVSPDIIFDVEKQFKTHSGRLDINNNRTVTEATDKDLMEDDFEVHQHCYSTNDVLEIIALTCLVNFIFWFVIIFCVNISTKNQKSGKFSSFESLKSIGSGSEGEINQDYFKKPEDFHLLNQRNLKGYVNSIISETEGENSENESHQPFSRSFFKSNAVRTGSEEKINTEKWIHQRFIHLSNIFFDTVSLDDLKPVKKKNFVSLNKNNKIVNSFSMEDLIF